MNKKMNGGEIPDGFKKYIQKGEIICTSMLDAPTIFVYEIQRQGTLNNNAIRWDMWQLVNNSATNA